MGKKGRLVKIAIISAAALALVGGAVRYYKQNFTVRPDVKRFIDACLYTYEGIDIDKLMLPAGPRIKTKPKKPQPFKADRYQVAFFDMYGNKLVILLQTEEVVGHKAKVIPGETKIGGYVKLYFSLSDDGPNPVLNSRELDYLIESLYRGFAEPLGPKDEDSLNRAKDFALAIKFSGRSGIMEYHNDLVNRVKSK
ncbi:MAG: hypothetical protein M1548_10280 [Actinobacteria bacterium]|nr:hypothetical protein [Actinomycetota bacterium]